MDISTGDWKAHPTLAKVIQDLSWADQRLRKPCSLELGHHTSHLEWRDARHLPSSAVVGGMDDIRNEAAMRAFIFAMSRGKPRTFSDKVGQGRVLLAESMQKISDQRRLIANLEIDGKNVKQARHQLKTMLVELEEMLAEQHQVMMEEIHNVEPEA